MSKRGLYLGGHSRTFLNPQMGYLCANPFGHLTRKPKKRKRNPLNPFRGRDASERYAERLAKEGAPLPKTLRRILEKSILRRSLFQRGE